MWLCARINFRLAMEVLRVVLGLADTTVECRVVRHGNAKALGSDDIETMLTAYRRRTLERRAS